MGAFDMLSDDDPIVLAHESSKLHRGCGRHLHEYTKQELNEELNRRSQIESSILKEISELEGRLFTLKGSLK